MPQYIASSLGRKETLLLAQHWLKDVLNLTNPVSSRKSGLSTSPAAYSQPSKNSNRLVVTKDITRKLEYATLSHCWGNIEFFEAQKEQFSNSTRRE